MSDLSLFRVVSMVKYGKRDYYGGLAPCNVQEFRHGAPPTDITRLPYLGDAVRLRRLT